MIKKQVRLMSLLLSTMLLTGCWDYEDIEKKSIIFAVGVDAVDDGIEFSGEIADITGLIGKEVSQKELPGIYRFLSHGINFEQARLNLDRKLAYPSFLGASRVVVFSNQIAKLQGIEPYLNRINKIYDYRKTVRPVISRERPKELFQLKPENDISIGFEIEDILNTLKLSGTTLDITVGDLISAQQIGTIGYLMPYVGEENGTVAYLGFAVMKNSKLIGVIDIQDTDGILYVLSKEPRLVEFVEFFERNKNVYSFLVDIRKRDIKVNYIDEKIHIDIKLELNASIRYQYYIEPISEGEIKQLENMISDKVKNDIIQNIYRSQKQFSCDYFQFAKYFRAAHPITYEQIDWEKKYPKAAVHVNVKTTIINKNLLDPNAKKAYEGE